jgi:hypothetical protein
MDIIPLHLQIVHNVMNHVLLVPILQVHHVHPVVMVFFILRHKEHVQQIVHQDIIIHH